MNFQIENEILSIQDLSENKTVISSTPYDYEVFWHSESPKKILEENYNLGDIIFIDENVYNLFFNNENKILKHNFYVFNASEENKTMESVLKFCNFLSEKDINKGNKIIVIGGGITQDVGGFAAHIYKRGIDWVFFPTTLLSMCDSCIGGKNGLNFSGYKNQLALFANPKKIYICKEFLKTLTKYDLDSGLGEILKLFAISGENFLKKFNNSKDIDNCFNMSKKAISIKKSVIEKDPLEYNIRKSLNYGHTIGHAIETISEYKISHGEAVVIGMYLINDMFSDEDVLLKNSCLGLIDKEKIKNLNLDNLENILKKDKKTLNNKLTFIILDKPGKISFLKKELNDEIFNKINLSFKKLKNEYLNNWM